MDILNNSDFEGLNIEVHENLFPSPNDIFEKLEQEIRYLPCDKTQVFIKGKICKIPRRVAAFGSPGLSYTFSGLSVPCEPWIPLLVQIRNKVQEITGCSFNFVLINRYKDGDDCIGQHRDNECDLTEDYPIVSVSLGESRSMIFKRRNFKDYHLQLKDNSMLIMKAPTNKLWTHGIPRQMDKKGVRISLTFRNILIRSKRKNEESSTETNKKVQKEYEKSQNRGFFSMDDIPEGTYPVGENVFMTRNVYSQKSIMHLSRYKPYGKLYYPTKEGITMDVHEFDMLLRSDIPQQLGELFTVDDRLGYTLDLTCLEGDRLKLTKRYDRPNGQEATTSIVINNEQWGEMKNCHNLLMEQLINDWLSSIDFKDMFMTWSKVCQFECQPQKSIPESWDVSLGTMHLSSILQSVIMDLLVKKGKLIIPETSVGEILTSNTVIDFNTAVKDLNMYEVMQNFYSKVTDKKANDTFLLRNVAEYVTLDFLDSIDFPYIISEIRRKMCPTIGMTSVCI